MRHTLNPRYLVAAAAIFLSAACGSATSTQPDVAAETPAYRWEDDLRQRLAVDFSATEEQVTEYIRRYIPDLTAAQMRAWGGFGGVGVYGYRRHAALLPCRRAQPLPHRPAVPGHKAGGRRRRTQQQRAGKPQKHSGDYIRGHSRRTHSRTEAHARDLYAHSRGGCRACGRDHTLLAAISAARRSPPERRAASVDERTELHNRPRRVPPQHALHGAEGRCGRACDLQRDIRIHLRGRAARPAVNRVAPVRHHVGRIPRVHIRARAAHTLHAAVARPCRTRRRRCRHTRAEGRTDLPIHLRTLSVGLGTRILHHRQHTRICGRQRPRRLRAGEPALHHPLPHKRHTRPDSRAAS